MQMQRTPYSIEASGGNLERQMQSCKLDSCQIRNWPTSLILQRGPLSIFMYKFPSAPGEIMTPLGPKVRVVFMGNQ